MNSELRLLLVLIALSSFATLMLKYLSLEYPLWFYLIGFIYRMRHNIGPARGFEWNFSKKDIGRSSSPNIILILADDLGVNDISGKNGVSTPNIDSLFQNGVKFSNAYAGHATCAPARASIFTGRFATRFGYEYTPVPAIFSELLAKAEKTSKGSTVRYGTFHSERKSQVPRMGDMVVPLTESFISDKLKTVGYDTAYVGKWHLGEATGYRPQERGFDQFLGMLQGASLFMPVDGENLVNAEIKGEPTDDFIRYNGIFAVDDHDGNKFEPDEYLTDYLAREASNAIFAQSKTNKDTAPFFLTVSFNAPHTPFQALRSDYEDPEISKIEDHKQRVYAAMIKSLDRGVGRILQAVKDTGKEDNTIIIFTSDNGGATYTGLKNINYPYRGGKATFFEGGLRVPLLMKWPEKITKKGVDCTSTVSHLDIFATIAKATSLPTNTGNAIDGYDLVPLLINNNNEPNYNPLTYPVNKTEEINIDVELLKRINLNVKSVSSHSLPSISNQINNRVLYWRSGYYKSLRTGDWKIKISEKPNKIWFYNLKEDPTEQNNLAENLSPNDIDLVASDHSIIADSHDFENNIDNNCLSNSSSKISYLSNIDSILINQCQTVVMDNLINQDQIVASSLCTLLSKLLKMDKKEMKESLWPSLSESPVSVDHSDVLSLDEEYIYWPN